MDSTPFNSPRYHFNTYIIEIELFNYFTNNLIVTTPLNLSMDESAIKGNGSDNCVVEVLGYDTSLQQFLVKLMLKKHFTSCGKVKFVYVPRDLVNGILKRTAFIQIEGEGAEEKALELSGSDVGDWKIVVKAAPSQKQFHDPVIKSSPESYRLYVRGCDDSLPEIDIQIALAKHYYSCGEIMSILVYHDGTGIAYLTILGGQDTENKARALNGCDVGGCKFEVDMVIPPNSSKGRPPRSCGYCLPPARMRELEEAERKRKLEEEAAAAKRTSGKKQKKAVS